jgi:pimeloyl-ACP methyl ester carboxylesterase
MLLCAHAYAQSAVKVTRAGGDGPPMMFLPHIGCSSEMWREMTQHYHKKYACYLVDFAGFNGQKPIDTLYTERYVNDLAAFIKNNKLKNAILVGQNYGAFIAVKMSLDAGLDVKAIIASDFYPKLSMVIDPKMTHEKMELLKNSIRKGIMTSDAEAFKANQKQTAEMMNFITPNHTEAFVQWQVNSDRKTLAETLCQQFEADLIPALKVNKIPLLVFTTWYFARKYKSLPISDAGEKLKEMYGDIPRVTHAVTEDAKDFIATDQPLWFIAETDKFLKENAFGK